jgi:hypothetical protein
VDVGERRLEDLPPAAADQLSEGTAFQLSQRSSESRLRRPVGKPDGPIGRQNDQREGQRLEARGVTAGVTVTAAVTVALHRFGRFPRVRVTAVAIDRQALLNPRLTPCYLVAYRILPGQPAKSFPIAEPGRRRRVDAIS